MTYQIYIVFEIFVMPRNKDTSFAKYHLAKGSIKWLKRKK